MAEESHTDDDHVTLVRGAREREDDAQPQTGSAYAPDREDEIALVEASGIPPEAGQEEGRYERREMLGEGGMGKIYLYADNRIGRDVAMKVLRNRYSGKQDTVARFVREARVQGQLEHPSIVPVYDLMRRPDGPLCFTMKRVRGKTLEQIVSGLNTKDRKFIDSYPRRKLLRAFSAACLAVDFAHTRGVLHRDLKPSNIMLGDYGEIYVLDWGLAKVAGVQEAPAPTSVVEVPEDGGAATLDGAVLGTPGYMSPEQARGDTGAMGPHSDVYSLGTILYEMLALDPLHQRGTVSRMMNSTVRGADGRPSFRSPRRSIPSELDAICVKATQLDPAHRFSSARELHDALERYLDGEQDMKLMREMAQAHARAAEVASEYALAAGPNSHEERVRALREVGRALALDPSHAEAQRVLIKLLAEPPQELPEEEAIEVEQEDVSEGRRTANLGGWLHLGMLVTGGILFWMGIRSWTALFLYVFATLSAAGVAFLTVQNRGLSPNSRLFANAIASSLAIGFMSTIFGPLFLVPGLAAVGTMATSFNTPTRSARALVIIIGLLAVLVPMGLELVGLLPESYVFTEAGLLIKPRMVDFPHNATMVFLFAFAVGHIVSVSMMMGRLHEARIHALEKLHKQTWQLKQLISDTSER